MSEYYKKNRVARLEYQRKNPLYCHICDVSYTNSKSHFRNTKYVIKHQAFLHYRLKSQD
jgi:hypothetical protein